MGIFHKNIQLIQEFLNSPFLVLHFSYYKLITFLMMLSVILLVMLMILLSILSVIRNLICDNNLHWLLNLKLIFKTLWFGPRSGLLISMLGKLKWFHLTSLMTLVLLMWKWMGLFLKKKHLLRCWGWPSLANWIRALTLSLLLKLPPALYLYKSTISPCMEYYCDVWAGAPSCYLELLDKIQKWICSIVGRSLAASLEPFVYCRDVARSSLFYRCYFCRRSSELAQPVPLPFFSGRSTRYSYRMHIFSVAIYRCYRDVYVKDVSVLVQLNFRILCL